MEPEQIMELLQSIYGETNFFNVIAVFPERDTFVLKDFTGKERFYKYELDVDQDTITIYNDFGAFKRRRFISSFLAVAQ